MQKPSHRIRQRLPLQASLRCYLGMFLALAWLAMSAAQAQTTTYVLGTSTVLIGPAAAPIYHQERPMTPDVPEQGTAPPIRPRQGPTRVIRRQGWLGYTDRSNQAPLVLAAKHQADGRRRVLWQQLSGQ